MNDANVNPQPKLYIVYEFFVYDESTQYFKLQQPFSKQLVQQIQFCLCLFGKNHIIYYPVFPCIFTEEIMAAKIAEVAEISEVSEIHYFRQQNICWGNSFYVGLLV